MLAIYLFRHTFARLIEVYECLLRVCQCHYSGNKMANWNIRIHRRILGGDPTPACKSYLSVHLKLMLPPLLILSIAPDDALATSELAALVGANSKRFENGFKSFEITI